MKRCIGEKKRFDARYVKLPLQMLLYVVCCVLFDLPTMQSKSDNVMPISGVFKLMQQRRTVKVWLQGERAVYLKGVICGFDEFMNVTLGECEEVKRGNTRSLGTIVVKGDCVAMLSAV